MGFKWFENVLSLDLSPYHIETSPFQSKSMDWFLYDGVSIMKELKSMSMFRLQIKEKKTFKMNAIILLKW